MLTLTRRFMRHIPRCTHVRTYASPAAGTQAPGAYCADVVRRHDYEGFLCAPFYAPGAPRAGFLALKAFQVRRMCGHSAGADDARNADRARGRVRRGVEPARRAHAHAVLARRRCVRRRGARPHIFSSHAPAHTAQGKPVRHPIALALHDANTHARLPVHLFRRIIDARVRALC
jgi:NADH dehydrogenase [ubiquinone] 1 alpha subcomplex assembly factor 6